MRRPAKSESFEHFYLTKVGLGECCGCAERIIDLHEMTRLHRTEVRTSVGMRFRNRAKMGFPKPMLTAFQNAIQRVRGQSPR